MTDTNPRDLIKFLIDALKEECNWIDNPKHDELIAKANAYITQHEPEVATDEELNSKSSPNNLQIRSSLTPPPELFAEWLAEAKRLHPGESTGFIAGEVAQLAYRAGADQELEACCEYMQHEDFHGFATELRAARRPKPLSLKEQALAALERYEAEEWCEEMTFDSEIIRRALEQLPNAVVTLTHLS